LELEPEPTPGPLASPSKKLVKGVERVIEPTVLGIVVPFSENNLN
jgi:hypothetical protein